MIEQNMPHIADSARVNRAFLRRAILYMMDHGIRQFLDIGSGIPTVGNVHEIAQSADPECRVVYVDKEPVAVAHGRILLRGNDKAATIRADIRDPEEILGRPECKQLLDFTRPIGLITLLVWHFVPDYDDPAGLLARYRAALAPGSILALTHFTLDDSSEGLRQALAEVNSRGREQMFPRTHEQVSAMFSGFELADPGLVVCPAWRPQGPGDFSDSPGSNALLYAGVAHVPAPSG
jgi:SAM-dependent methyltransferase